jgi:hypothetical protein
MRLEDKNGLPWTASSGLGWIVLIVALSSGIALVALSLYLALWIYSKGRSALSLAGFALTVLLSCTIATLDHWHVLSLLSNSLAIIDALVWIASVYLLRYQLQKYCRESKGWNIEIGPWLTLFFSSIYINYCLNPIDLSSDHEDTLTSLNIGAESTSAKITK